MREVRRNEGRKRELIRWSFSGVREGGREGPPPRSAPPPPRRRKKEGFNGHLDGGEDFMVTWMEGRIQWSL